MIDGQRVRKGADDRRNTEDPQQQAECVQRVDALGPVVERTRRHVGVHDPIVGQNGTDTDEDVPVGVS